MKTLFSRLLVALLSVFLLLVATVALAVQMGFSASERRWAREKQKELAEIALSILEGDTDSADPRIPMNIPFSVFDASGKLVYSNARRGAGGPAPGMAMGPGAGQRGRRMGRQGSGAATGIPPDACMEIPPMPQPELRPLEREGETIGYYSGFQRFQSDTANAAYLDTLREIILFSVLGASAAALLLSFLFSRSLSKPAKTLAEGIRGLADGNYGAAIEERGTEEIAGIARAVNALRSQLLREGQIRARWAQDIAHDLRTPLSALRAQMEGMRDGVLTADSARLERILEELGRMERLVSDLGELERLEDPETKAAWEEIDLSDFMGGIVQLFAGETARKGLTVRGLTDFIGQRIRGDRELLSRGMSNIVANAVTYADEKGEIEFSIDDDGGRALIRVTNTGPGIPEQELPRVFDRLYRGEYARSSPGSGLGLTIAKRIVELHGGGISLTSGKGKTSVTVSLPREGTLPKNRFFGTVTDLGNG